VYFLALIVLCEVEQISKAIGLLADVEAGQVSWDEQTGTANSLLLC
jgi:hypothetical protein